MAADFTSLLVGYVVGGVASSVSLAIDGDRVVVVDPGMVAQRGLLSGAVAAAGFSTSEVTDVVVTHLHLDHTMNVALFDRAVVHDFMASYHDDIWENHPIDRFELSPSIYALATPGHTREDISIFVETEEGLVVCSHLWWSKKGPLQDPYSFDHQVLEASRARVLGMDPYLIVPGHGEPFLADELDLA